jgi:mannobiose 2-epimerase
MELSQYKNELKNELSAILDYWQSNTIDNVSGGFYGKLDNFNNITQDAPKGSVLNSRILWAFSAACNLTGNAGYLNTAQRAFLFILDHFIDKKNGGVYWSVNHKGEPYDTKKQIYALAFAIYGLSEFNLCARNEKALQAAIELYNLIIDHSLDKKNGGYIEALSENWSAITDLRLSSKDANEKKSMNTHLHVLEAFANLYRAWPDEVLKKRITDIINLFLKYIIDKKTGHLILFFDENWSSRSNVISYGHDIEAAWLIQESAEIIHDQELLEKVKKQSVKIADAAAKGLDKDGGLWYEYDADKDHLIKEKHSWPQAESMIGFFNAWQLTGNEDYLEKSVNSWKFTKKYILDKMNGEWFWGIKEDYSRMEEDKVGIWKCPYHNTRACIELIRRIDKMI